MGENAVESLASSLDSRLSDAVAQWLDSGDTSLASWRVMMAGVLKRPLVAHLQDEYSNSLAARGIKPASDHQAILAVGRALANTDDLRLRVLNAPATTALTAGFSLGALIDAVHQNSIIQSITQVVQDFFGRKSVDDSLPDPSEVPDPDNPPDGYVGFTGNKQWNVNSDRSRHPELDGTVVGPDETFTMPDGAQFYGPRDDITDAANSSGCQCSLSYEFQDEDGTIDYR